MMRINLNRRGIIAGVATILLAGCSVVPKPGPVSTKEPEEATTPSATQLPGDKERHRIALLVPLSGENAAVGTSLANAANMALMDTNASNLRITTYDTSTGASAAAAKAVADGNKLILGPLVGTDIAPIVAIARPAGVPIISYSNDATAAAEDVFIMGQIPSQSIGRTVGYARAKGAMRFAALLPYGEYGRQVGESFQEAVTANGGTLVMTEQFDRANTSIISAAQRIAQKGKVDAVLIADSARLTGFAANKIRPGGGGTALLLGTELLSGEAVVTKDPAMRGMIFSAISDSRFGRFADSYRTRFGKQPYRLATLGYDSVLLALRIAQEWKFGKTFPVAKIRDRGGFLGLDGPFRFDKKGLIERSMEVREIRQGQVVIVSEAPKEFIN